MDDEKIIASFWKRNNAGHFAQNKFTGICVPSLD